MLPFIFLLIVLSSTSYAQDRLCGTNLANLWLDVVYVIDNSAPMTNGGLIRASAQIISVFGANTRIGSGYTDPRSTRVGIVTYNRNATIAADLNRFTSYNDLASNIYGVVGTVSQQSLAVLESGLTLAGQVLDVGRANNIRANYQPVIVVYASQFALDNDVVKVSDILKNRGITIITIPSDRNVNLTMISSKNDDIEAGGYGSVTEVQNRLLEINCFCPSTSPSYHQFYGTCVRANSRATSWTVARLACETAQGYLANERTQAKHDYLFSLVQNSTDFSAPYDYFIGLSTDSNGTWTWDGSGDALSAPTFWDKGAPPSEISGILVVYNYEVGTSTAWQTTGRNTLMGYICEISACDTDNYCS